METNKIIGKCPICGGDIIATDKGWECSNKSRLTTPCSFSIRKEIRGVKVTEDMTRELISTRHSHIFQIKDKQGRCCLAHLEIDDSSVRLVHETKYLKRRCPHCGGRIRVTSKGYYCENTFGKVPTCKFHCNGILSHRFITPAEFDAYLDGHPTILDGCFNSLGRIFSAVLVENDLMGMSLTSVVGKCPVCGSDILVSPVAFNCANHETFGEPHHFTLWRHIKGYELTLDDVRDLLRDGVTSNEVVLNNEHGLLSKARLQLSPDKKRVIPVYTE